MKTALTELKIMVDNRILELKTKDMTPEAKNLAAAVINELSMFVNIGIESLLAKEKQQIVDAVNEQAKESARLANTLLGYEMLSSTGKSGDIYFTETFNAK